MAFANSEKWNISNNTLCRTKLLEEQCFIQMLPSTNCYHLFQHVTWGMQIIVSVPHISTNDCCKPEVPNLSSAFVVDYGCLLF